MNAGRNMKRWLAPARKEEKDATTTVGAETTKKKETTVFQPATEPTEAANWAMIVELVQPVFREGKLAEEATLQAVVLIPKGKKDYQGIGLV